MLRSVLITTVIAVMAVGCAPSTELTTHWVDDAYDGGAIRTIAIIGVSSNETTRRVFERSMAREFERRGVEAIPGTKLIPDSKQMDEETVRKAVKTNGIDAVLVTRVAGIDAETHYSPGQAYAVPIAYGGFYNYYSYAWKVAYTPGYATEYEIVKLETNVYETATSKLIWAGISESFDPRNVEDVVPPLADVLLKQLKKDKLIH